MTSSESDYDSLLRESIGDDKKTLRLKTLWRQKNEFSETTNQGIFVASYPHKKRDINQLMNKKTLSRPYQMYPLPSFRLRTTTPILGQVMRSS